MMDSKIKQFLSNTSFSVLAQVVSLSVSAFLILVIPKLLDVESFGYWQLYLLYASYVGLLHFGLIDGIYLRYGGYYYEKLEKKLFRSQFWILFVVEATFAVIILICSLYLIDSENRRIIFSYISLHLLLLMLSRFFIFILQSTNRIKEYVIIVITERLIFLVFTSAILILGIRDFEYIILSDLSAKAFSLIPCFIFCKELIIGRITSCKISMNEAWLNISAGIKLMFSNIAGMLIIGIVRFLIERNWDIVTFGKISLTLSISNIFLVFIGAVSVVIFPMLKRLSEKWLSDLYYMIRNLIMLALIGMLLLYFPLRLILGYWLPTYEDKLVYLVILFPISLFESKMTLLISTYLKALRKEQLLLKINLISVMFCIVLTVLAIYLFNNLNFAVISIILIFAFRSILAELFLSKLLKLKLIKDILYEVVVTTIFIILGWYLDFKIALPAYFFIFIIYLLLKKREIKKSVKLFKQFAYK